MSFQFTTRAGKDFEKPVTGMYHGILADIVDLGDVPTTFNGVTKIGPRTRFVWILDQNGKDGKPLTVTAGFNNNLHEKSKLYASVKQILNAPPPITLDPESLIGSVRKLFIQRETTATTDYANILGISPADAGKTVAVPADFVRDKNKPVAEQAKNKKKQAAAAPAVAPALQPAASQAPVVAPDAAALLIAQLQAQLAAAVKTAGQSTPPQGADVAF